MGFKEFPRPLVHEFWRDMSLSKELKAVPSQLDVQPLFLSVDDTMVEKEGKKSNYAQGFLIM